MNRRQFFKGALTTSAVLAAPAIIKAAEPEILTGEFRGRIVGKTIWAQELDLREGAYIEHCQIFPTLPIGRYAINIHTDENVYFCRNTIRLPSEYPHKSTISGWFV